MSCDVSEEIFTNQSVSEFSCPELCDDKIECLYFFNSSHQQCTMYGTFSANVNQSIGPLYQKMGMWPDKALMKCFCSVLAQKALTPFI